MNITKWQSRALAAAGAFAALVAAPAVVHAVAPDIWPSFTQAQADTGKALYAERCANCHGAQLEGIGTPALSGSSFLRRWADGNKAVGALYTKMRDTMPMMAPHSLSETEYTNILAFILSHAGYNAGAVPLSPVAMGTVLKPPAKAAGLAGGPHPPLPTVPATVEQATTAGPDDAELAAGSDASWLMYNRVYTGARYSGLDQINRSTAKNLQVKCIFQAGEVGTFQTSPVIYGGMMYLTTGWTTYAIDPTSCRTIWTHSYPADEDVELTGVRGVAVYRGKVFRVTPDAHLLALDAKTGKLLWDVWVADKADGYALALAPIAFDGKVFIGEAGADWGANSHVYAFDTETGRRVWTFNLIPTGKEFGAASWKSGAEHGGGSMWTSLALDPTKGLLYVPVGNPAPDFEGAMRAGDNLFTDSVVVLDAKTGKLAWHVQQVPHDTHDWDTAAAPIIYELNGKGYMAVANKGGWLYLYDRATHKLIARTEVSTHKDEDKPLTLAGVHHCPGIMGGAEWNGPAFSPKEKLVYVNTVDWCGTTKLAESRYVQGALYFGGDYVFDPVASAKGWTRAVDATTGKAVWSRQSSTPMVAGVTPTAGDVVLTGDLDGYFLVLDARTGETLYRFNTGGAVAGGVSSYSIDGKQYVAAATGNSSRTVWKTSGAATVVVFGLAQ
jgi:PQQ-dependent dehydrogenase (methanol/ethanol family)